MTENTLEELGADLGVASERARQIADRGLRDFHEALKVTARPRPLPCAVPASPPQPKPAPDERPDR